MTHRIRGIYSWTQVQDDEVLYPEGYSSRDVWIDAEVIISGDGKNEERLYEVTLLSATDSKTGKDYTEELRGSKDIEELAIDIGVAEGGGR